MDKMTRDVRTFHETFGCPVRDEPGLPELDDMSKSLLIAYAQQMLVLAARLKTSAATANRRGKRGLGDVLVRLQLHVEEGGELALGIANGDLVNVLKEIADIDYVTAGTFHVLGLGKLRRKAHDLVHASNMSKLGEDGKPMVHESGRVIKGPNYRRAEDDLRALLGDAFRV